MTYYHTYILRNKIALYEGILDFDTSMNPKVQSYEITKHHSRQWCSKYDCFLVSECQVMRVWKNFNSARRACGAAHNCGWPRWSQLLSLLCLKTGCPLCVWNKIPWLFNDFSLTKIHFPLTISPSFHAHLLPLQPSAMPAFSVTPIKLNPTYVWASHQKYVFKSKIQTTGRK